MTLSRDTTFCCHSYLPKSFCFPTLGRRYVFFPTFGIHRSYFILHPLYAVSRNQVSFVTGLHSYLIQPVAKIHIIALAPPSPPKGGCNRAKGIVQTACQRNHGRGFKIFFTYRSSFSTLVFTNPFRRGWYLSPKPPGGGCSNAARTGASSFHPASLLRLLRNRRRLLGVRFSAGAGLVPRQSADPETSWRSNTSRHHVAGRTPSGCLR